MLPPPKLYDNCSLVKKFGGFIFEVLDWVIFKLNSVLRPGYIKGKKVSADRMSKEKLFCGPLVICFRINILQL